MTRLKTLITAFLIATIILFVACSAAMTVSADYTEVTETVETYEDGGETEETDETDEETEETEETDESIESVAASFVAWLKIALGENFETYYNSIIDTWGSVEEYLMQFGEYVPEQYQTGWQDFVAWLSEYAPIWATILAIALVIIVFTVGRKIFKGILQKTVDSKTETLSEELNKQSTAQAAQSKALIALLGNNEKFATYVKELEDTQKNLES